MDRKNIVLLFVLLLLAACAPKYNYFNSQSKQQKFDYVIVVIDYLHFIDDVGKLLDYPADINKQQLEKLKTLIENTLHSKGYTGVIDFAFISSGIGLNPDMGFEHYIERELQEELIYPPFYLESTYPDHVQQQLVHSFADSQNVVFYPVTKKNLEQFSEIRMNRISANFSLGTEGNNAPSEANIGVLHIRAVFPRVSFMKAMGVSLISAGLTAGATGGAYIGVATPVGAPHSTGLLFDNSSGELLWKNQLNGDLSRAGKQTKIKFFKDFPELD